MTSIKEVTDYAVENGIAVVTIDSPPVNALSHIVRLGIREGLDRAFSEPTVVAAVLMCAGRTFFAGADITEFGKPMASPVLREIAVQIEGATKPVVAAIHGTALGGGLEIALACHWRIAGRSAKLGLPEVKLGLLAGAGGTQRLPRLVGVDKALEMVVSGDTVAAQEALEFGLIDALSDNKLRADAIAFAADVATRSDSLRRVRDLPPPSTTPEVFARFRAEKGERLRGFEAPEASIQCIEASIIQSFDEGMKTERRLFENLMSGVQCAAQRYAFFAERDAAKVPGLSKGVAARSINAAVLVGGFEKNLGERLNVVGINVLFTDDLNGMPPALSPHSAIVFDFDSRVEQSSLAQAGAIIASCGRRSRSNAAVSIRFGPSVEAPQLMEVLRTANVTDEVLVTVLALAKRMGLTGVVTLGGDELISSLMTARLAHEVDRCIEDGVPLAKLLEVAADFGLAVNVPTIVNSKPGLVGTADILNRLIVPVINEGAKLLEAKVAARASDIDLVCLREGMWKGYRGGPMFHAGQLGLEQVISTLQDFERRWGADYRPSPLLEWLAKEGQPLHLFKGFNNG